MPSNINEGLLLYFDVKFFNAIIRGEVANYNKIMSLLDQRLKQANVKEIPALESIKKKNTLLKELLLEHKTNEEILTYYYPGTYLSDYWDI